ncbi:ABC transporter permease [Salinisphaera japonica]|uniref:ABC transporter permease n=1 Tax=Salinisphaera japonica YTM-1 TaxID=1209778 RepID=A0A423PX28_9GAMM|nr:ABC transporter permease [Salinisphaera japonica]ROO30072.1 ABC transporter permease [Salinisphaera japonica YTM-1]
MSATLAIMRLETRRLFVSPLSWVLAAMTQLLTGLLFVMTLTDIQNNPNALADAGGVTVFVAGGLMRFVTLILLLVVPLLTMRSIAEERKQGTWPWLVASPIGTSALVAGKFFGVMGYLTLIWALTAAMPAALAVFSPLDMGILAAGLIGLWLMMASFAALGLLASAMTREPSLAAVITLTAILLAWLAYAVSAIDWQPVVFDHALDIAGMIRGASPIGHLDSLLRGLFTTADLVYFAVFVLACLALTVLRLDAERR